MTGSTASRRKLSLSDNRYKTVQHQYFLGKPKYGFDTQLTELVHHVSECLAHAIPIIGSAGLIVVSNALTDIGFSQGPVIVCGLVARPAFTCAE